MKANIVVDISPPVPCLPKFWFSIYGPKCRQPVFRKACDEVVFLPADKHKTFEG